MVPAPFDSAALTNSPPPSSARGTSVSALDPVDGRVVPEATAFVASSAAVVAVLAAVAAAEIAMAAVTGIAVVAALVVEVVAVVVAVVVVVVVVVLTIAMSSVVVVVVVVVVDVVVIRAHVPFLIIDPCNGFSPFSHTGCSLHSVIVCDTLSWYVPFAHS